MAFFDIFRSSDTVLSAALSGIPDFPLASPWQDSSQVEQITLANLYGLDASNLPLTRSGALTIASVAKGRNILCSTVARMPLQAKKNGVLLDVQPPMLSQIQTGVPNFQTVSAVVDSLIFFGRAYLLITEINTVDGRPKTFKYVPEAHAETENGILKKAFGNPVASSGYLRIDGPHEGILNTGRDVLQAAKDVERISRDTAANPNPNIVLKQTGGSALDREEIESLRSYWLAGRRKKGGTVAYLSQDMQADVIGQAAQDVIISALNNSAIEIARIMGLPAFAIDANVAGSSLTYSNSTSQMKMIIDMGCMPYIAAIESLFTMLLPQGQTAFFDISPLLRGDFRERMEAYEIALRAGIYSQEEIRELEGLDPAIPGEVKELPAPSPTEATQ
ncbi:phage portal protein [Arthrobacter alpinus]|uniref:phage portal protein n=1 Tax=Arthrobacter alpinus TaxID=656366 RepID=UPI0016456CAB|nr:phage portal protein [Arthrobacter alpinus]